MTAFRTRSNARRWFAAEAPLDSANRPCRRAAGGISGALHRRWPLVLLLALLPLALGGQSTEAFRGWCMRDPAFMIDGQVAHVRVGVDVDKLRTARTLSLDEPIHLTLTVPKGVEADFLGGDNGFGSGYSYQIEYDPSLNKQNLAETPVRVDVVVPMKDQASSVRVRVAFVPTMGGTPSTHGHGQGHGPKDNGHRPPHAQLKGGYAEGFVNQTVSWPPSQP